MNQSKERFPVLEIAKINLRHNSRLSIAVAAVLCLLVPLLIGTANLDQKSAAMPLEMFVSPDRHCAVDAGVSAGTK